LTHTHACRGKLGAANRKITLRSNDNNNNNNLTVNSQLYTHTLQIAELSRALNVSLRNAADVSDDNGDLLASMAAKERDSARVLARCEATMAHLAVRWLQTND
jgi:hypothetical protein